jgi:hypothetical protein
LRNIMLEWMALIAGLLEYLMGAYSTMRFGRILAAKEKK